jgi:hypothetical protein
LGDDVRAREWFRRDPTAVPHGAVARPARRDLRRRVLGGHPAGFCHIIWIAGVSLLVTSLVAVGVRVEVAFLVRDHPSVSRCLGGDLLDRRRHAPASMCRRCSDPSSFGYSRDT